MKKHIALLTLAGLLATSPAWGSGYRIPEQSVNSVALSGAYVANAMSADASYHNPANMGWVHADCWSADGSLTYINLAKISYTDQNPAFSGESNQENFLVPQLHLVSPDMNHFRLGLSMVAPAGLSKRWEDPYPRTFAEDFTLKVVELSPSISYTMADKYGIAAGVRLLHAKGKVRSSGTIMSMATDLNPALPEEALFSQISRSMEGDTLEYGWNVAVSAKASDALTFAATYRSNVDLDLESDTVILSTTGFTHSIVGPLVPAQTWAGEAEVSVPVPAVLTLAGAYTFGNTTVELVWDRTFWSEYEKLDFNYAGGDLANPILYGAFDEAKDKSWDDADAYRLGITHQANHCLTLMAGIAYDENPVPDHTLSFELPDSDAWLFSLGLRYQVDENLAVGAGYLYDMKDSRSVVNDNIEGEFEDAAAHLLSLGVSLTF